MTSLTQGPTATNLQTSATQQVLPDWYNEYIQGLAARGLNIAAQPYKPYTGAVVAGPSPLQQAAYAGVTGAADAYKPYLGSATTTMNNVMPTFNAGLPTANNFGTTAVNAATTGAQGALDAYRQYGLQGANSAVTAGANANAAVAGPAMTWDAEAAKKYMSPYISSVVDEIGRLGTRNLNENIMPNVNAAFIGSGQFGSSRNANILGDSIRDAQRDISGVQSQALQSGYGQAADIFGADASRVQNQGQIQANTALDAGTLTSGALNTLASGLSNATLNGAELVANTNNTAGANFASNLVNQAKLGVDTANAQGALGTLAQTNALTGVNAQNTLGKEMQANQQAGLDAAAEEYAKAQGWDMAQLNALKSLLSGIQLPVGSLQASSAPGATGPSPLDWVYSILAGNAGGAAPPGNVGPVGPSRP